jgi:hypothetical protein
MLRNLLICIGMASRESVLLIILPAWHCRIRGSAPVFWHICGVTSGWRLLPNERKVKISFPQLSADTPNGRSFRLQHFVGTGSKMESTNRKTLEVELHRKLNDPRTIGC